MRRRNLGAAALMLLSALLLALSVGGRDQSALAGQVIRLHVLAHSDSPRDQELKLKVRDAVLQETEPLLEQARTPEEARAVLSRHLGELERTARRTLLGEGCPYPVRVSLGPGWFPTRRYQDFALPAGRYTTLRLEIGAARGRNWWCVVYPPMCSVGIEEVEPAALPLTGEQVGLIRETEPEYVIRFRLMELWGTLEGRLSNR